MGWSGKCCEISLTIAKEMRGKGLGKTVLDTLKSWLIRQGIEDVYAEIKPENAASIKTFERAGFQLLGTAEKFLGESGEKIAIRRYLLPLKESKKEAQDIVDKARTDADTLIREAEENSVSILASVEEEVQKQTEKLREESKQKLALDVQALEKEFLNDRESLREKAEKNWQSALSYIIDQTLPQKS